MKARTWLQGAGAAALLLFPLYDTAISNLSNVRMHTPAPPAMFASSLIANLAVVSLLLAVLGGWLRDRTGGSQLKLLLPGLVFASLVEAVHINTEGFESVHLWMIVAVAVTALALLLRLRWPRGERALLQVASATLMGLGFFSFYVVLQLLRLASWQPSPNFTAHTQTPINASGGPRRIVWILFDELSYQQVFGHRYSGLRLPNFDELRKSSTVYTNSLPVGSATEKVVPSILLNERISRVDYTASNRLEVASGNGALHPFDAAATPFALAHQQGLTTAVVGWYNPYCSILAPYLNQCYWTDDMVTPSVFAGEGFWQNFFDPWVRYAMVFRHVKRRKTLAYRVRAYRDLMRHAQAMLRQPGPEFIFLHLPLPHPPGIYNRQLGQMDTSGTRSYIDNLALTDKTLGQILLPLQQSPQWRDTSVVICGDHSWRVPTWTKTRYWSAEDEAASNGEVFDRRPMIMVHQAGETFPATVIAPFSLLRVHTILDDLIAGGRPPVGATAISRVSTP